MMSTLKKIVTNFFVVTLLVYLIWLVFFDRNSLMYHRERKQKFSQLKQDKKFYKEEIKSLQEGYQGLTTNPELLEKYARERYNFKRKGEDVYVIKRKQNDN